MGRQLTVGLKAFTAHIVRLFRYYTEVMCLHVFTFKPCTLLTFPVNKVAAAGHISSHEKHSYHVVAASQINKTYFLIKTDRYEQLLRQCPCRKLTRRVSYLLNAYSWYQSYRVRQQIFPSEDCGCCFVCPSGRFGARSSSPKVKHIIQMCHNLGWAWMLLKASVRPQQESGASFDEEMAFLPFLGRMVACLSLPWGRCRVFFLYLWRCQWRGGSSLCQIAIKIWRFSGWKRKCQNKKRWKHLRRERRRDGRCSIWTFCPLRSSRLENVPLPSYSTLYLMAVDFSSNQSSSSYCDCRCQSEFF